MLATIFSTQDKHGGAGAAAHRHALSLRSHGVHAPIFCHQRRSTDLFTYQCVPRLQEVSSALRANLALWDKVRALYITSNRPELSSTLYSPALTRNTGLPDSPAVPYSRVFHLHWINYFFDASTLSALAAFRIPTFITMHDEWLYTGGCHYTAGCDQFVTSCHQCPQLLSDPLHLCNWWFEEKRGALDLLRPTIITPSEWLAARARRSSLLANCKVVTVRNAFDTETFAPLSAEERTQQRSKIGIGEDEIIFCFIAASTRDRRKGLHILSEAIDALSNTAAFQNAKPRLLVIGDGLMQGKLADPNLCIQVGNITAEPQLRNILGACDCLVVPSLEENYPNVIIEALLVRTPVIAFSVGGITEQITDGVNGLLCAEECDSRALFAALHAYLENSSVRWALSQFETAGLRSRHSLATIGEKHISLYREANPTFDDPLPNDIRNFLRQWMPGTANNAVPSYPTFHRGSLPPALAALLRASVQALTRR